MDGAKGGETRLGARVGANGWGKGKHDKTCFYFGECSMLQKYWWWANQMTIERKKKKKKEKLSRWNPSLISRSMKRRPHYMSSNKGWMFQNKDVPTHPPLLFIR
jgi:hypothetical protein